MNFIFCRNITTCFLVLVLLLGSFNFALAQDENVEIHFFYSPTCPHCAQEKAFLDELSEEYPELNIKRYDVINSREAQELLKRFYKEYEISPSLRGLVPATFTPEKYFVGFDQRIAGEIKNCLKECLRPEKEELSLTHTSIIEKSIKLPLFGEINLSSLSFSAMAVILGALDGFNVCSLGALVLILSLVLVLNSRRRIIAFGGIFILTTALVYGFLIFFWYKIFEMAAPYLKIMNILIGGLGIAGAVYFLRQFWKARKNALTCESEAGGKISSRFLPKLQELFKSPSSLFLAMGAVFAFAFVVTVVEFPCSAMVPVAFAAALSQASLPLVAYLLYIAIFVLFYMLDEIIVFLFAVFTSRIWLNSPRFLKWIYLIEAVILFFFGIYYLVGF